MHVIYELASNSSAATHDGLQPLLKWLDAEVHNVLTEVDQRREPCIRLIRCGRTMLAIFHLTGAADERLRLQRGVDRYSRSIWEAPPEVVENDAPKSRNISACHLS